MRVILYMGAGVVFFLGAVAPGWAENELSWTDTLREAAKNNPDLIAAREEVTQQEEGKKIVQSGALPQVTAEASASTSQSNTSGSSKSFGYGVSGSQLIFDGLKTVNLIRSSSENVRAAGENFKFASATVRFRLRQAFIGLLKAQELLNLTEEIYKIRKSNLDLITLRYQSGREHKGALLTAQANLSQASSDVNQAKRGVEVAERQLVKEMGRKEFSSVAVQGDFEIDPLDQEKPNFEMLAKKNPSLLNSIAQKNAAAFDASASVGNLFPELKLSGGLSKSDGTWPPQDRETSAGLRVSVPIFEGGANLARIAQSKSVYRQREQQERSTKDEVVLTLAETWNGLQDAVENVAVQKDFLNAAVERSKIAEEQYTVGLISFDNWTIIEDDLVRNKKAYLDVQTNALLAEANWVLAKGETLEYEE